jgi:hypothetical protein
MGGDRWSSYDWGAYKSAHIDNKADHDLFSRRGMHPDMDPRNITLRESCDSDVNPNATPIIIALDVTGSMGHIAVEMAREGIKTTIEEILNRKPVSDPHIMVMGVGDPEMYDTAPLQVSQFEADTKIIEQLSNIYLEGGGGGNGHEGYNMPWYFAATKTKIDSFDKRGKKGLLFTIGDEDPALTLHRTSVKEFIGDDIQYDLPSERLLELVQQKYDVFHVVVEEGSHARYNPNAVVAKWNDLLGEGRVIRLSDHTKLPEVLVSAIQVNAGENVDDVTKSWDGTTGLVVSHAVKNLAVNQNRKPGGLVKFG